VTRAEILDTAKSYVTKDRAATHGNAENSFALIAELWSAYLGAKVEAHDVAALLVLFKLARYRSNPGHADNSVDAAGYSALMGELGAEVGK
jgi:hypothetical protein